MQSRYEKFVENVSYGLSQKFKLTNIHNSNWVHKLIPDSLAQPIEEEINKALHFQLSATQTLIFNSLDDKTLLTLRANIIGDISFGKDFSYLTNTDVKANGLCKLYYEYLHWDKSEHLWGKIFKMAGYTPKPRFSFFKGMTCATKDHLAGTLKEENGFKEREVHIVSIFCFELAKLATLKAQLALAREIEQPDNQAIKIMRTPHDLDKWMTRVNAIDSEGYLTYVTNLFTLLLRDKITHGVLFKDTLPLDISSIISLFLTKEDECNLVCVNKSAIKEKEKALDDFKNTYCRK